MGNKLASFPADKKIVIVGAGYGGAELGLNLVKSKANFTIIDPRDALHNNMASSRALIVPGFANKTMIPYKPTFGDHYRQGKVINIDASGKKVSLESGEDIIYDKLVIATGTSGPFPMKHDMSISSKTAIEQYEEIASRIKSATSVTVIGGGAAGVESACEIATEYPDKKVTLIHGGNSLLKYPGVSENFLNILMEKMKSWKINVLLNTKVTNIADISAGSPATVETDNGSSIDSDVTLVATGLKINSDAYKDTIPEQVEANGALKVNEHLQVEGQPDIYAIGDCNNVAENKLAIAAQKQAKLVYHNLSVSFSGDGKLEAYKANTLPLAMVLALGKCIGMAQLMSGTILPEFLANKMKAPDVMTKTTWKSFGQTPPK